MVHLKVFVLVLLCDSVFLKVGAEKRPTWEDLLRRPQHEDYYLGKASATPTRVSLLSFFSHLENLTTVI